MTYGNSRTRAAVSGLVAGVVGGAVGGMSVLALGVLVGAALAEADPRGVSPYMFAIIVAAPIAALVGAAVGVPAGLIGGLVAGGPIVGRHYRRAILAGMLVGALGVGALYGGPGLLAGSSNAVSTLWLALLGALGGLPAVWVTLALFNEMVGASPAPRTKRAMPDFNVRRVLGHANAPWVALALMIAVPIAWVVLLGGELGLDGSLLWAVGTALCVLALLALALLAAEAMWPFIPSDPPPPPPTNSATTPPPAAGDASQTPPSPTPRSTG